MKLFKRRSSEYGPGRAEIKISEEAAVIHLLLQGGTVAIARGLLGGTDVHSRPAGEEADRKDEALLQHHRLTVTLYYLHWQI